MILRFVALWFVIQKGALTQTLFAALKDQAGENMSG